MKIHFVLCWNQKSYKKIDQIFGNTKYGDLFKEYTQRIKKIIPCQLSHISVDALLGEDPLVLGCDQKWFCHSSSPGLALKSEEIAKKLASVQNQSTKSLGIFIGPPDGWSPQMLSQFRAKGFFWSFGPITLPHELASVVCAEQVYRALTINRNEPYHLGH